MNEAGRGSRTTRLGLTGGIASGKTMVAEELARLGATVIDADVLAREVVECGTPGLAEVVQRFGEDVLLADGTLDRAKLGEVVFSDPRARSDLNDIIHPRVRAAARLLEDSCPQGSVVVHVIPMLVETGQQGGFDGVIVVDVPVHLQVERLMRRNALSAEQAQHRIDAQASREKRLAAADWVIDNSGDPDSALRELRALWHGPIAQQRERLVARFPTV